MSYYDTIVETIGEILEERNDPVPQLRPSTPVSECGLDSLDVASLVVRLQDRVGFDPFEEHLDHYPRTLRELAELYEREKPVS